MTSEAPSPEQATPQQGREGFPVVRVAALLGVRWMLRGLTIGIVGVCVVALITRTLPEVWPIDPTVGNKRLSYPLGYWNALGILASVGLILCFHLGSDAREQRMVRVLGCAACPLLAATLLLTFSRGATQAARRARVSGGGRIRP